MIPQRDLSLLSNRLAERGGRRIPEAVLELDYCLSWFLVGLSRSGLRERLALRTERLGMGKSVDTTFSTTLMW